MSDTPCVSAYPERARRWSPQTRDDFRAFDLYDADTISHIAAVLPGFAEGMDHHVLAGLLRAWASQHLAIRRGTNPDTAADVRETYRAAIAAAHELETALGKLPVAEKGRMASMRSVGTDSSLDAWTKNLNYVMSAPRGLAALIEQTAEAHVRSVRAEQGTEARELRRGRLPRGRRRGEQLQRAVRELCYIYRVVTGARPTRHYDAIEGHDGGPFVAFVQIVIKPLWPNARGAGGHIKEAVRWYRNRYLDT